MSLIGSVLTGMESRRTGAELERQKSVMEEYVERLGTLSTRLHELELLLRTVLFRAEGPSPVVNLNTVKVGDVVPVNAVSDYATLGALIKRYNSHVDEARKIDRDAVVSLRDTLAHGRFNTVQEHPPFRLVTFGRPKDGVVEVTSIVENMDEAWFTARRATVDEATTRAWSTLVLSLLESEAGTSPG